MSFKSFLTLPLMAIIMASCGNSQTSTDSQTASSAVETIMTRTSIRKYQDKKVEQDKIDVMLKAAMAAPTACNKQPWQFVVIDDRATLDSLAAKSDPHKPLLSAPLAIVVCGDMQKALTEDAQLYWVEDCSAAMENLLLAAHAQGLGAVWLGVFPMQERVDVVRNQLNLPSYIVPLGIASIGYPDEAPQPKDKWKPENVHKNVW